MENKEFTIPVTVEFEDTDAYQIAHHTKLVAYLERARVHFMKQIGIDLTKSDPHLVMHNLDMRFIKTVKFLDRLDVTVFVKSCDTLRIVLGYKIRKSSDLVAKATTELVFVEPGTQSVVPVPDDFLSKIKQIAPSGEEG